MSEEYFEQEELGNENYVPVVEEEQTEGNSDVENEQESQEQLEDKKEYKPWKEKKTPETIPYDRFAEVNRERRELERRLVEVEQRNREYEELKVKSASINSIKDLNEKMSEMSIEEYNINLVRLIKDDLQKEQDERDSKARIKEIEDKIFSEFTNRVDSASKKNPEIKEAVDHVSKFANYIPAETRYALLTDDNSPDVIYEIATTEGLLESIIRMNQTDAIRRIAKISAKYDSTSRPLEIPRAMEQVKAVGTPKIPASSKPSIRRYSDEEVSKMTSSEYAKAKRDGRI